MLGTLSLPNGLVETAQGFGGQEERGELTFLTADEHGWTRMADEKLCCCAAHGQGRVGRRVASKENAAAALSSRNDGRQSFSTAYDRRENFFMTFGLLRG
jgi:hypothetical protein